MWLSSVYGPHGNAPGESESQTWVRASVSSWTNCGCTWWQLDALYITSHRCSNVFRSKEWESQSMSPMPSSSRNCRHTLATWGQALSCTRRKPGPTPAYDLTTALGISSWYLTSVMVPLTMTWRSVWRFIHYKSCDFICTVISIKKKCSLGQTNLLSSSLPQNLFFSL